MSGFGQSQLLYSNKLLCSVGLRVFASLFSKGTKEAEQGALGARDKYIAFYYLAESAQRFSYGGGEGVGGGVGGGGRMPPNSSA